MSAELKTGTPWSWRLGLWLMVAILAFLANILSARLGYRGQAILGFFALILLAASFSTDLRAINAKTIIWGLILQFALGFLVLYVDQVQAFFRVIGSGITTLVDCADKGADFVFGSLSKVDGPAGFVFAFKALPPIIFVSAFFSLLYYLGVLQFLVSIMAKVMMFLMGTSGAETLSVAANVFMGQTEAPLIVKPFVPKMTRSELLALMASGMAHISGGMMAVYISYGADPVAILTTCIMACPCSLYLTKLVLPELQKPVTMGDAKIVVEKTHVNAVDAIASGVKDGLFLALNVAAMLIAFIAFIALFDAMLSSIKPALLWMRVPAEWLSSWPSNLQLQDIFGFLFRPIAILIGVSPDDATKVGGLLGIKLAANEHVAFLMLKKGNQITDLTLWAQTLHSFHHSAFQSTIYAINEHIAALSKNGGDQFAFLSPRSKLLAVFALTGFANFASVGIQIGGIGSIAPERRHDLARLGMKALFVGFLATLVNACVAGMLMKE
ncbi:MAG TPA: nucleoside transporter C-terminal domain-containing protein [Gemmatales bacterium]|nr:nucleoside transporter C-terminal domain-containing protein [Gemmatales bacterium]